MALQPEGPGAYAPPRAVIGIIERWRERGVPTPITADTLVRASVTTDSLTPRTLQTLKLLDLIDDSGQPTDEFVELRKVSSDQYKDRLAALLRVAYADVLAHVDPTKDDYERIRDAFRVYSPPGLRDRMVTLFLGLAEYAGLISGDRAKELTGRRSSKPRPNRPAPARGAKSQPQPSSNGSGTGTSEPSDTTARTERPKDGRLPPALEGFMRALPEPGTSVSTKRREQYVQAFASNFDLSYDVQEESEGNE
jgi:Family of unknown function (DUF5343)